MKNIEKIFLSILLSVFLCSFFPWTSKTVPAESVSAPVLLEVPDEEEIQDIQEVPEEIPDEAGIREVQEEITGEERIQKIREKIPDGGEEKATIAGIPIDKAHFPDSNFCKYLVISSFDKNKDGILSEQEIKNVTSIDCHKSDSDQGSQGWGKIESLEGIGFFTEITTLNCEGNNLTSLDVSQNKKLRHLECGGNDLTSLDVSQNRELKYLYCSKNELTGLDVSQNKKLRNFFCSENALTNLDVSQNKELTYFYCFKNALTNLDVSQNKELIVLICDDNRLESLVGVDIICHEYTDVGRSISCAGNLLSKLDLRGESEGELGALDCRDNRLTSLQIGENTYISTLHCEGNRLSHLDLRGGAKEVYCNDNELISLKLGHVSEVHCQNNALRELNLRNSPYLCYVDCSENMLRSLDMSRNFLEDLSIYDGNIGRQTLICNDNRLESIKFGKDIYLECLYCENNRLRTLDLSEMPHLFVFNSDPGTKVIYTSTPRLVSLKRDQKKAILTWEHDEKICDGFFIYRKEGKGGWKKVGEIRKRFGKGRYSYTDEYTGKGSVTYTVRAFRSMRPGADEDTYEDCQGGYDKRGLSASAVPSAPKNLRAAAGNGQAKLTWKKVSGASGYQIYRKDPKSSKWKKIADVKTGKTTYIDKKVKKGKMYSYCVRAYKKGTGKNKNVVANGVLSAEKKAKIK